jgi:hypothetical protein
MTKSIATLVGALLILLPLAGCHTQTHTSNLSALNHPGQLWLSWTASDRDNFVLTYVQGYETGVAETCLAVQHITEEDSANSVQSGGRPHVLLHERCSASVDSYSRYNIDPSTNGDFHTYTDAITSFYSKHEEFRNVPFIYLMQFMSDQQHKSPDELYAMAKEGRIRTHW